MHRIMNLNVTFENPDGRIFTGEDGLLLVPNPISYVDVIVIGALRPCRVRHRVARGQSKRRRSSATSRAPPAARSSSAVIAWAFCKMWINSLRSLNEGVNVTLFPEGSTLAGRGAGGVQEDSR